MLSLKTFSNFLDSCKGIRDLSGSLHTATGSFEMLQILDTSVYKPEYFKTYELVPPEVFSVLGEKALALMDSRILWTFDAIREYFKAPITINNYTTAKPGEYIYKDSGFRVAPVGSAAYSQHLFGRAGDLKIKGVSAADARAEIKAKWKTEPAFRFITAIEDGVSWLHVDNRNNNTDQLLIFSKG